MTKESKGKYKVSIKKYVNIKRVSVGTIPSIKIGGRVLFDLHDIDMVMADHKGKLKG